MTARKAVDPIIATLLLIAIAVAAGIIVYVYVNSLAGGLTQGGGSQVSEGLSLDSYSYGSTLTVNVRDTGGSAISIAQVYLDGLQCETGGLSCGAVSATEPASGGCTGSILPVSCTTTEYVALSTTVGSGYTSSGTSHVVRIVTADGGTFTFSVVAGRSG